MDGIESNVVGLELEGFGVVVEDVGGGRDDVVYVGSEEGDGERVGDIMMGR